MTDTERKQSVTLWSWAMLALCAIGLVVIAVILSYNTNSTKNISSYAECQDAGGSIAESYPEQCFIGGKSFVNPNQNTGTKTGTADTASYFGLSEADALAKAAAENIPARVVERDGEPLPVTMDYAPGRLNLTVKYGKVIQVDVE